MSKAKLKRRLDKLTASGKGHLRAARRAFAHLENQQWEPQGTRVFMYQPWKQQRKAKRKNTVHNVRPKEHVTSRLKSVLAGPRAFIIRWAQGLRMRQGNR